MSDPRPVRIARAGASAAARPAEAVQPSGGEVTVRPNSGATRRAIRIAWVYVGSILLLTVILTALGLASPDAGRPGVRGGLELFLGVAAVLAGASVVYALTPAPRRVELRGGNLVVVGRWGRRRSFGEPADLVVRVVRRFSTGVLSPEPVELVQVAARHGRVATFEADPGLFAALPPRT